MQVLFKDVTLLLKYLPAKKRPLSNTGIKIIFFALVNIASLLKFLNWILDQIGGLALYKIFFPCSNPRRDVFYFLLDGNS
jgi:hypothetical protein